MDMSKLSRGQLIAGAGGALLIVSLFLSWLSLDGASASAFDAFSGMDIIMLVIGIAAIAFAAMTAAEASVELPTRSAAILSVLGVLIVGWALGWVLEFANAGFGAWLGLIAAGAIAYGGWEAYATPTPMVSPRRSSSAGATAATTRAPSTSPGASTPPSGTPGGSPSSPPGSAEGQSGGSSEPGGV